ncbi:hypothetical protein ABT336_27325 [Micromonospora sp. NPDC000207]|uniref:hypothetical protein n=1 Tax=Micromonospora sp. NPDC000207 TaxID=3154246 RepID=UPI00332D235D
MVAERPADTIRKQTDTETKRGERKILKQILIIPGNTNLTSFGNCLTAATEVLQGNLNDGSAGFRKVHVVHTTESLTAFTSLQGEISIPEPLDLRQSDFVHHVVDLSSNSKQRLDELLSEVASIARLKPAEELYFDLTGGVTQVKVALGILAFLLGARNVYTLEVGFTQPYQRNWNLEHLRTEGVRVTYSQTSGLDQFDQFGLSNLTAVRRVRPELNELKQKLESLFPESSSQLDHLVSVLEQAEALRLQQEDRLKQADRVDRVELAATRSILFHATAAAEALVDLVVEQSAPRSGLSNSTLGPKLRQLRDLAGAHPSHPIDTVTLGHLTDLLLRLRNRAAHWSDRASDASVMEIQGEVGLRLSKSFIWLELLTRSS